VSIPELSLVEYGRVFLTMLVASVGANWDGDLGITSLAWGKAEVVGMGGVLSAAVSGALHSSFMRTYFSTVNVLSCPCLR
jgi:hypothetical protein